MGRLIHILFNFTRQGALLLCTFLVMQASAQQSVRIAPVIHLPETIHFCPDVDFTIRPDSITGGTPPYQYRWQHAEELIGSEDSLLLNLSDSMEILLTVIDSNGKLSREAIIVAPYEGLDAQFETNYWEGCKPLKVIFTSNNAAFQHMASMDWDFGNTDLRSQFASVVYEYDEPGIYSPSLSITDLHGCIWRDTLVIPIRVYPVPVAHFTLEESNIYLPETRVSIENESEGADHYNWQYTGGIPIEGFEPSIVLPENVETSYSLKLTATNAFGCSHSFSRPVQVLQAIELFIPNSFTPNGDHVNDTWQLEGQGIDAFHVRIEVYDVWGTIVFSTQNPYEAWEGLAANRIEKLAAGNYNYRIIARDTERGIGHLFEGHITLLY